MPIGAAAAVVGSAAVGSAVQAKASNKAGKIAADASIKAGEIEAASARDATQLQRDIYVDQRNLSTPAARLGAGALARQAVMAGMSEDEARSFYNGTVSAYGGGGSGGGGALSDFGAEQIDWGAYVRSNPDVQAIQDIIEGRSQGDEGQRQFLQGYQQNAQPGESLGAYHYRVAGEQFGREHPAGYGNHAAPIPGGGALDPADDLGDLSAFAPRTFSHPAFSFDGSDLTDDPSYQWRLDQGTRAVERSQAARGRLFSGQTGSALHDYAQGLASTEYAAAYARASGEYDREYTNHWNEFQTDDNKRWTRLGALSGAGEDATAQLIDAGDNYADGATQTVLAAGQAQGAGVRGAGSARASGAAGAGRAWGEFWREDVPGALGFVNW